MSSLPQVLHEAATRSATEIILEAGQPPAIRTEAGAVRFGDVLAEGDLFDVLSQVLAPEQQAELVVGNVVEFHVDVEEGRWTLVTEPGVDGILVRGRLQPGPGAGEVGTPMELPPLEPFTPEGADKVPRAPNPVFRRTTRQTRWDLGVGEAPQPQPEAGVPPPPSRPPLSQAPSSRSPVGRGEPRPDPGHWQSGSGLDHQSENAGQVGGSDDRVRLADALDEPAAVDSRAGSDGQPGFDVSQGHEGPSDFEGQPGFDTSQAVGGSSAHDGAAVLGGQLRDAASPDPEVHPGFDNSTGGDGQFAERLPSLGSSGPRASRPPLELEPDEAELGVEVPSGLLDTQRPGGDGGATRMPAQTVDSPIDFELRTPTGEQPANLLDAHEDLRAPPTRDVPTPPEVHLPASAAVALAGPGLDPWQDLVRSLEPGTLCFIRGEGQGEQLAERVHDVYHIVDDADPLGARAVASASVGATFIVRLEDPSQCLSWVLRRLEEGALVIIETRARSFEGARRVLLGVDAGPRADAWLDAHVVRWLSQHDGYWVLR